MISMKNNLKKFKPKAIYKNEERKEYLHGFLENIEKKVNSINRSNKKSVILIEDLKEEVKKKNDDIRFLKNELVQKEIKEEKFGKKIVYILDQIDIIYRFAKQSKNEALINNIERIMKGIRKELRDIQIEEVPAIGEIFNLEIHECVEVVEDRCKERYEIIDVMKKGYKLNEKVLRVASVIAVK